MGLFLCCHQGLQENIVLVMELTIVTVSDRSVLVMVMYYYQSFSTLSVRPDLDSETQSVVIPYLSYQGNW